MQVPASAHAARSVQPILLLEGFLALREVPTANEGYLGGQWTADADAVDLQPVPEAHDTSKHSIADHWVDRQRLTAKLNMT